MATLATLATESGRRVSPRNDFCRLGEGCRSAEQTYGLRTTGAPDRLEPPVTGSGGRDARRLVRLLSEPAEAAGLGPKDRAVYHLVVASAKADAGRGLGADPALPDKVWAQIATDLMDRTGLAPQASAPRTARRCSRSPVRSPTGRCPPSRRPT